MGRGNESLFAASGSHDQDGHHATPRPYMVKTLQKSSTLELVGRFPRNLVCGIRDSGPIIVCSNDDLGLTLTYFTARSNLVICVFEWEKLLHGHLMGKTCSK